FEEPTREWHFEEIIKETKMARSKVNSWLKKFIKEELVKRVKPKGKMPYYVGNHNSSKYRGRKRLFALFKIYRSGLLDHLINLKKAKTVIVFGSFARSDWYKNSDVDVFIYGDSEGLKLVDYELKLGRDIQLFICKNKKELIKYGEGLLRNIIKGNLIKGNLDFIEVGVNA
ncbi:MAG: nucleotidyltransferase domain-containing protein, partial [Nanoarchaeota archaeon]|nr:nucleotidyltransferase domain-containing protein [Nanoarchaeota archaeon]